MDVLRTIRESVDTALTEGKTFQSFKKDLTPTLQKLGWWGVKDMVDPVTGETVEAQLGSPRRLRVIYRTNLRTARAAGQWQRAQRTKKSHPYLIYQLGPSERHRPEHVRWNGLILPIDADFWKTHYPPNGWGCKCRVRQVTKREADRLGGESRPPHITRSKWINERTGEIMMVPKGIDPGWDHNFGDRSRIMKRNLDETEKAFKSAMDKDPPKQPERIWPEDDPVVFSTVKGIDRGAIEGALSQIPNAKPQIDALRKFMEAHPVKVLALRKSQMKVGNSATKLVAELSRFFGRQVNLWEFTQRGRKYLGWTRRDLDHVMVVASKNNELNGLDPESMAAAVSDAVESHRNNTIRFSISSSHEAITKNSQSSILITMAHEIGHQMHYWTQGKKPVQDSLTLVGRMNDREWHAEHFAAWFLNRKALAEWNPDVAEYFDNMVADAVKSKQKMR